MRVLLVSDHFPPYIGGAHRWAALLGPGLARRGHAVTVATVWHGGTPRVEMFGDPPVEVHRVRQVRTAAARAVRKGRQRYAPPFPDPVSARDLRRVLDQAKPDVVLSHGWISYSLLPALAGTDIPLILSSHDYGYFCAKRDLLYRGRPCPGPAPLKCLTCASGFYGPGKGVAAVAGVWLSQPPLTRRAAALQSVTTFVDELNSRFVLAGSRDADRVRRFVIPAYLSPDPLDDSDEGQRVLDQLPREPFILFVGALRPLKGVEVLFEAYGQLNSPPPLVLIGTMERDTPKSFPPGIQVFTDVAHSTVMQAWGRALFGVAPSVWPEPLATVCVEGITMGVPMIGTVQTGMIDVLGNGVGLLVPSGDAQALAEAMRSLIDDPDLRAELSAKGRAHAPLFQDEHVIPRYEAMLREVVAGN